MKKGKLLIVSAPSGSGKSTIVNWLMQEHPELKLTFSVSCTSRAPRGTEQNGVEYFFQGLNVVFDVDVKGGINIKKHYRKRAMSIFIQPPSIDELRRRLEGRGTDTPEVIEQRLAKAEYELTFAPKFDHIVVNDDLATAEAEALKLVEDFLNSAN